VDCIGSLGEVTVSFRLVQVSSVTATRVVFTNQKWLKLLLELTFVRWSAVASRQRHWVSLDR